MIGHFFNHLSALQTPLLFIDMFYGRFILRCLSSLCISFAALFFICFDFRFGYFWPPVNRTIENWITCQHNLSLHRFITAAQLSFVSSHAVSHSPSVTFIDDGTLEQSIQSDSYITPLSYYAIQFVRKMDNNKMCTKNNWSIEKERWRGREIRAVFFSGTWFVYKTLSRTLLKVTQWKGICSIQWTQ